VQPVSVVPLADITGIASSAGSAGMAPKSVKVQQMLGFSRLRHFNLVDFQDEELLFGDGGRLDITAIYPMLRYQEAAC
jgi:hypothetical protein